MSLIPAAVKRWNVVVVEDDARTRRYFSQCVEESPALRLLASVGTVQAALQWAAEAAERPQVLLTDLGLPDGSGIDVIREFRSRFPDCEALVVSMFGDEEHVLGSIEAGALGYVHKDSEPQNVANTILELKAGGSPISPGIARRLLTRFGRPAAESRPAPSAGAPSNGPLDALEDPGITAREAEILDLLARGFAYAEIASLCKLSRNTVATHVKSIYRKMQVHSRGEAVYEALNMGIIGRQPTR
jgi:DNA-binding NarL/FixJ family response regulator